MAGAAFLVEAGAHSKLVPLNAHSPEKHIIFCSEDERRRLLAADEELKALHDAKQLEHVEMPWGGAAAWLWFKGKRCPPVLLVRTAADNIYLALHDANGDSNMSNRDSVALSMSTLFRVNDLGERGVLRVGSFDLFERRPRAIGSSTGHRKRPAAAAQHRRVLPAPDDVPAPDDGRRDDECGERVREDGGGCRRPLGAGCGWRGHGGDGARDG